MTRALTHGGAGGGHTGIFSDRVGAAGCAIKYRSLDRVLGIRVEARLVKPNSIQRSEGKAKRVLDHCNEKSSK